MVFLAGANLSDCEILFGSVSSVASFLVVLTYFVFPDLRKLRYVELCTYGEFWQMFCIRCCLLDSYAIFISLICCIVVAFNNMVGSLGMSLGQQDNGSLGCGFQAFASNANYLSAILWTTVIAYQVYLAVVHRTLIMDMTWIHVTCWGLPILVTLLPLIDVKYANSNDASAWCFFHSSNPDIQMFWQITGFYFWVVLSQLTNITLIVLCEYQISQMVAVGDYILSTTRRLNLYPLVITICWVPVSVYDLGEAKYRDYRLATIMAILPGLILSVAFFVLNPYVTKRWKRWILDRCWCGGDGSRDRLMTPDFLCEADIDIEVQPDYLPRATEHNGTICGTDGVRMDLPKWPATGPSVVELGTQVS